RCLNNSPIKRAQADRSMLACIARPRPLAMPHGGRLAARRCTRNIRARTAFHRLQFLLFFRAWRAMTSEKFQ
ncbi:MAG: hypothetical protein WA801_11610, partial [Pseudolabrys sp.]